MRRTQSARLGAIRVNSWRAAQGAAAATIAWALAKVLESDHEPFFAPIAAFIALNAPLGERGLNALRLLVGVFAGIAVGEATVAVSGGYGGMAVATFAAASAATALGGSRIVIAQAVSAAILVVAVADEPGLYRALDALIGAGVALVFSQALFSPQPLALLRRAEAAALAGVAEGLELTSQALARDDEEEGRRAVDRLRDLRDQLVELSRVRGASSHVARRSAAWRAQRAPVVRESESAGHLDLLAGSTLSFARAALAASTAARTWLAPSVRDLARAVADLADEPGDRAVRQRAADRALEVANRLEKADAAPDPSLVAAVATGRIVAADLMAFAGVEPEDIAAALREEDAEVDVATPPPMTSRPFGLPARVPADDGRIRRAARAARRRLRRRS